MGGAAHGGLNVSGDEGVTRIVEKGALHYSQGQSTSLHAHYAWKIHVGIDASVWLGDGADPRRRVPTRVLVVPPGTVHRTGAIGWSAAIFVAPGSRKTPWRATCGPFAAEGRAAERIVAACRGFDPLLRCSAPDFIDEVVSLALADVPKVHVDARVEESLVRLRHDPGHDLSDLAQRVGLSLDRLSRLVSQGTGMRLRQHAVWNRLLSLLSSNRRFTSVAAAAMEAGFSDHAHMTRTYRAYLGRAPSEFRTPPDAIAPW